MSEDECAAGAVTKTTQHQAEQELLPADEVDFSNDETSDNDQGSITGSAGHCNESNSSAAEEENNGADCSESEVEF